MKKLLACALGTAMLSLFSGAHAQSQSNTLPELTFSSDLVNALNQGTVQVSAGLTPIHAQTTPLPLAGSVLTIDSMHIDLTTNTLYGNLGSGGSIVLTQLVSPISGLPSAPPAGNLILNSAALAQLEAQIITTSAPINSNTITITAFTPAQLPSIPEPGTWALMALGLAAVSVARYRQQ